MDNLSYLQKTNFHQDLIRFEKFELLIQILNIVINIYLKFYIVGICMKRFLLYSFINGIKIITLLYYTYFFLFFYNNIIN